MLNLADCFHAHLEAKLAIDEKLKRDAHYIRYNVYCLERGYENDARFPDRMEKDEFDEGSVQALVRHKESKNPLGVVRLVLPNQNAPDWKFPIEEHFGHSFELDKMSQFRFDRENIAEVSRFAVSKQSMKQVQEQLAAEPHNTKRDQARNDPRHLLPHISLGLIAMLFTISRKHNIDYWYAAMEPSLSRLLTRLGIHFTPIGPVMDYHGKRQPMIAKVSDLLDNIQHNRKDFFALISDMGGVPGFIEEVIPGISVSG